MSPRDRRCHGGSENEEGREGGREEGVSTYGGMCSIISSKAIDWFGDFVGGLARNGEREGGREGGREGWVAGTNVLRTSPSVYLLLTL